jgi:protein O-mannosyl-transferase
MPQAGAGHDMLSSVQGRSWLIVAAVVAVYASAFTGAFQFDDYDVIVDNGAVHSFSAWASGLVHGIRPLLKLSYTLNWTSGWGLFGFHLFNTAIHAGNCILVFILSRRLLSRFSLPETGRETAAFGAALLFAVHPVQTEAVTYICGRSMSLMALFYFGSMLAYDHGIETGRKSFYYLLSPLLFLAAVAVKETAITLPLALVLWQLSGKPAPGRELFRNLLVHIAVLGMSVLAPLAHPGYRTLLMDGLAARAIGVNLLSQVTALSYLLSRFVMIHRLNIDPDLPFAPGWTPVIAVQALVLLLLVIAALVLFRKRTWLGFGLLWFFLHLLPTNSLIPRLDLANERHLYIAGWGAYIALAAEVSLLLKRGNAGSRAVTAAVALLFLTLGAGTIQRNTVYRSEVSFWEDAVKKTPSNARAHNNLGYAYFESGRRQEAATEYGKAIRLRPGYERAGENLRSLLALENEGSASGKGN